MSRLFTTLLNNARLCYNRPVVLTQLHNYSRSLIPQDTTTAQDFLFQNLKNAPTTNKVLELVSAHYQIMNKKHLIQALKSIFQLQKQGSTNLTTKQILKHPEFERICHNLKHQAGVIEVNDTIDALKVITYMGAPSNSTIVSVLLQLLRHNVNDLSLQQIIFLDFLLSHHENSPLIDALRLALPMVFEIQFPTKVDRDNLTQLVECLHYISKKDVSARCVEDHVKYLLKYKEDFGAKSAISIIWSICEMKADEFFEPLLTKAINSLILNIDSLSYSEIETTLSKLLRKYTPVLKFYYNETLCDVTANYIIDNDLGFDAAVYLQKRFTNIFHFNSYLLEYIAQKVVQNPNLVKRNEANKSAIVLSGLALCDCKPKKWEVLREHFEETTVFNSPTTRNILWLKTAAALCVLDLYKVEVFERALQADFLKSALSRGYKSDLYNLLTINQAISVFKPELRHLLPSREIIEPALEKAIYPIEKENIVEALLEKGVGGRKYIKNDLMSKIGHHIAHAVIYRKGGFPVAFGTEYENTRYIEDINLEAEQQMILLLVLPPPFYTINGRKVKGATALLIRTLEALGHPVVAFNLEEIEALSDFEKIPYIMQSIKQKLSSDFLGSDSAV